MLARNQHILYVEDDADTREMATLLLEFRGYQVTTASSVAEGSNLARSEGFDLYLIDNHFADGTGIELIQQMRTFDTRTPIIVYSGSSIEEDLEEAINAGAQAYLIKPTEIEVLNQTISKLLNGNNQE